ncbi:MAG TPA: IS30 family transposase [Chitinophagaceae bacterium]|nr:IS30 family transposase [Chitinophagaceae bacterium]
MARHYKQLTYAERCQIEILKSNSTTDAQIAKVLGKSRSTICREIKRNSCSGKYKAQSADIFSKKRKFRTPKKMRGALLAKIEGHLKDQQWSPSQIAGRLKREGIRISHETIYQHVSKDKKNGGLLYKHLRRSGKKYNKRSKGSAGRGCIPNRVDISLRPMIVEEKSRLGDWETDTIIGADHDGAIVSIVDRTSKLTKLAKVERKTALEVEQAILFKLSPLSDFVHTITSDNGKEFANHQAIAHALGATFYFAHPYHSWERGLNEHTNGLVRQYISKGERLSSISQEQLDEIESLLNHRPRASLNFNTPLEIFARLSHGHI